MGRRGPAPKPTAQKKLEGTYRPDRAPTNEAKPPTAIPAPPEWLSEAAREEWDRITPYLEHVGLVSHIDLALLAAYCDAWANWSRAARAVQESPKLTQEVGENGYRQQIPEVAIAKRYFEILKECAARFGLSPSDRSRIEVDSPPREVESRDETSRFLFRPEVA